MPPGNLDWLDTCSVICARRRCATALPHMVESNTRFWHGWRERARALRNVPALMRIVWESGRVVVAAGWGFRILGALVPIAMLSVAKLIFDAIQVRTGGGPLPEHFWWLVGLECLLAVPGLVISAEELLERVWDEAADPFSSAVKHTMHRLRAKLGDPPVIETIREGGYRIGPS